MKQLKITAKIFAHFSYQKFVSQKQGNIIAKNLPCFSDQKINVSKEAHSKHQSTTSYLHLPYFFPHSTVQDFFLSKLDYT